MKIKHLFFAGLWLSACSTAETNPHIYGTWQGVSWKVNGQESDRSVQDVRFEFHEDATYRAAYGTQQEQGTFQLKGDKLYTTGANKIEKVVGLSRLTADTMVMDMNRIGTPEILVLVKR